MGGAQFGNANESANSHHVIITYFGLPWWLVLSTKQTTLINHKQYGLISIHLSPRVLGKVYSI